MGLFCSQFVDKINTSMFISYTQSPALLALFVPPTMASTSRTSCGGNRLDVLSFPREIRDQVYSDLVVCAESIPFDRLLSPIIHDTETLNGVSLLSWWDSVPRLTQEACEIFLLAEHFRSRDRAPALVSPGFPKLPVDAT